LLTPDPLPALLLGDAMPINPATWMVFPDG